MKKLMMAFALLLSLGAFNHAEACTVAPVSELAQTNDMVANALTHLKVKIQDMKSVSVSNYQGRYIWTPMCPKGLTAEARLVISYGDDFSVGGCTAVLDVEKTHIYAEGFPRYEFDTVQEPYCLF